MLIKSPCFPASNSPMSLPMRVPSYCGKSKYEAAYPSFFNRSKSRLACSVLPDPSAPSMSISMPLAIRGLYKKRDAPTLPSGLVLARARPALAGLAAKIALVPVGRPVPRIFDACSRAGTSEPCFDPTDWKLLGIPAEEMGQPFVFAPAQIFEPA